ncbi:MAG: hypothetical protein HOE85_18450, partial [Nitrospinaceae bacterium]|nr:hypothetical protein [Nitrospinaceae bacterium]
MPGRTFGELLKAALLIVGGLEIVGENDGSFSADIDASMISTNIVFEVAALDMNGNETVAQVNLLKP